MLIDGVIDLYSLIVLGRVLLSWVDVSRDNPAASAVYRVTEPVLAPVRRVLPETGGVDFSPLVVLFGLRLLRMLL